MSAEGGTPAAARFVLGMPHLTYGGLSENWLLKTCGDLHWQAICAGMGRQSHEITDAAGNRLYPSFVELLHSGARLSDFGENDEIEIDVTVRKLSARRSWSCQRLAKRRSNTMLKMEMLTLFMKRGKAETSNVGLEATDPGAQIALTPFDPDRDASEIVDRRARIYDDEMANDAAGLDTAYRSLNTFEYRPCPTVDFNGARLLYFANYQDIVDRAEWAQFRHWPLQDFSTARRHIRYFGNIDLRDAILVEFLSAEFKNDTIEHEAALIRASDNKVIAEVRSRKERRSR